MPEQTSTERYLIQIEAEIRQAETAVKDFSAFMARQVVEIEASANRIVAALERINAAGGSVSGGVGGGGGFNQPSQPSPFEYESNYPFTTQNQPYPTQLYNQHIVYQQRTGRGVGSYYPGMDRARLSQMEQLWSAAGQDLYDPDIRELIARGLPPIMGASIPSPRMTHSGSPGAPASQIQAIEQALSGWGGGTGIAALPTGITLSNETKKIVDGVMRQRVWQVVDTAMLTSTGGPTVLGSLTQQYGPGGDLSRMLFSSGGGSTEFNYNLLGARAGAGARGGAPPLWDFDVSDRQLGRILNATSSMVESGADLDTVMTKLGRMSMGGNKLFTTRMTESATKVGASGDAETLEKFGIFSSQTNQKVGELTRTLDAQGNVLKQTSQLYENLNNAGNPLIKSQAELQESVSRSSSSWERHLSWIARGILVYQGFQLAVSGLQSFLSTQLEINDALKTFEIQTGRSEEEARQYMTTAQQIGRQVGLTGTDVMPSVSLTMRAGLPSQLPLYAGQLQRAWGVGAESSMGEYLSLMRSFPGVDPSMFGDMFTLMMQRSGFASAQNAWSLFGSAAPIAGQFGMDINQYTNLLGAMGRGQPERSPQILERMMRRFGDIYDNPDIRVMVEQTIGRQTQYYDGGGQLQKENLYGILQDIAKAPVPQQRRIAEQFPAELGQPYSTIFIPLMDALKEMEQQAISTAEAEGKLNEASRIGLETSEAAKKQLQGAWQELVSAITDDGETVINIMLGLAMVLRDIAGFFPAQPGGEWSDYEKRVQEKYGQPDYLNGYKVPPPVPSNPELTGGATQNPYLTYAAMSLTEGQRVLGMQGPQSRYGVLPSETIRLPEGVSLSQLMRYVPEAEEQLRRPITGESGESYKARLLGQISEPVQVLDQFGNTVTVVTGYLEALGMAAQMAAQNVLLPMGMSLPEGYRMAPGEMDMLQGQIDYFEANLHNQGVYLGERSKKSVYDQGTGQILGTLEGTAEGLSYAMAQQTDKFRKFGEAMDDAAAKTKAMAGEFEGWLNSALFSPSAVTEGQMSASRVGMYQNQPDETMRQVRSVINKLNAGTSRDKFEPYEWAIINDPQWQAMFPGVLTPGGRAVKPGDKDYDLRMTYLEKAEQKYYSGQLPWAINYDALAGQYQEFVAGRAAKESLLKTAPEEILKRLPEGADTSLIEAFIKTQNEAPIISTLMGNMTSKELQAQANEQIGQPIWKGMIEASEDYLTPGKGKGKSIVDIVVGAWQVQTDTEDKMKPVTDVGVVFGNAMITGVTSAWGKFDLVGAVTAMVFAKIAKAMGIVS